MEKSVSIAYLSVIFYPFVAPVFYLIVRKLTIKDFHYPFLVTSVFLSIIGYALAIAISYFLSYVESMSIIQQESESILEKIVTIFFCSPLLITLYFIASGVIAFVVIYALKPKLSEWE
jgi:hypothetical protein